MQETPILSGQATRQASGAPVSPTAAVPPARLVFDACHLGVILRAVLGVEAVVAIAALYSSSTAAGWLLQTAWLTAGALPGTLVWLLLACSLKRWLQRRRTEVQYLVGIALGALAGLYACASLLLAGALPDPPWLANAMAGGGIAALLVTGLVLRARGNTPAATTARLAELQSRIRPHFLFNTLNSAIALVRDDPARAESLLEDLSDLFRAALSETNSAVPLSGEIELARRYLAIEQVRFGERLHIHWDLEEMAHHASVPPLLLQPLVENAVRHGIEPCDIGGNVTVKTKLDGHNSVLTVTNTLCCSTTKKTHVAKGQGMALANVRNRLALLHDVQAACEIGEQEGLFVVRITVPSRPLQQ